MRFATFLLLAGLFLAEGTFAENFGEAYPAWWNQGRTPRPAEGFRRFDAVAFERWVAAQPAEAKPVVDTFREHIERVSQADFERELFALFQTTIVDVRDTRPLLFITLTGTEESKSGEWATSLIRERFARRCEGAAYLNLHFQDPSPEHLAKLRELAGAGRYRVVMVDDAIYTGRQMRNALIRISRCVPQVDILTPYATDGATTLLHMHRAWGIPVRLYRSKTIRTLRQIYEDLLPARREAIALVVDAERIFADNKTMTLFDHKAPDFLSFPLWVREGYLLGRVGGSLMPIDRGAAAIYQLTGAPPRIPFIVENHEPYKTCRDHVAATTTPK